MKTLRSTSGPFPEQPYFTKQEIENICTDELREVGLYPADPSPIRIDRFLEKRFGVPHRYDDLPHGLLGFTKFGPRGVEEIVVSRSLAEEGSKTAERRITTTLAHEGGHGLLHAHLFAIGLQSMSLFGGELDPQSPKILCRNGGIAGVGDKQRFYDGRWWEYQANLAMAALLLPMGLVERCLGTMVVPRGTFGRKILDPRYRVEAERLLAVVFDVNPLVARIRLSEVYPETEGGQLTL